MQVMIDGVPYVKQDDKPATSIGIGITTHNRQALAASTLAKIQAATPGACIVVVDDASQPRVRIPGR